MDSIAPTFDLSVVIPFYNEAPNVSEVLEELTAVLEKELAGAFEVVAVNDGSSDGTGALLEALALRRPNLRVVHIEPHSGQSAALEAGFAVCRAEAIATMDGDGQNDPRDIPRLLRLLHLEGVEMVCGIRARRRDGLVRRVSSRIANRVRDAALHDHTVDVGCSLRVFRRACLPRIHWFRNAHRFFPALVQLAGYRTAETPVAHRPRLHGQSRYGLGIQSRLWVGLMDLWGVCWLQHRALRYRAVEPAGPRPDAP